MRLIKNLRSEFGRSELGPFGMNEYQECAARTYRGPTDGDEKFEFLLLGLFGEIGSLLSELKKKQRDHNAYISYEASSLEETGDVLWYLTNIIGHCGMTLQEIAGYTTAGANARTFHELQPQNALFHGPADPSHVRSRLLHLAGSISALIRRQRSAGIIEGFASPLADVLEKLVSASNDAQIDLGQAAAENLAKALARWPLRRHWGQLLDAADEPSEQLPRLMYIRFEERQVDSRLRVFLTMNGVNIGDPLTDNRAQDDDYRFHDVFHLAFAGILGWSPVLRTLLNVRRTSQPAINENQDGARAKIAEEGIANWIFGYGVRHQAFEHADSIDFDLLKTIGAMVKGYEVELLPPWAWEHAILEAFRVLRFLRQHRGGLVTVDLKSRSLAVSSSNNEV